MLINSKYIDMRYIGDKIYTHIQNCRMLPIVKTWETAEEALDYLTDFAEKYQEYM